jgi:hypothetical protein
MENLVIVNKEQRIVKYIFGAAMILYAIISLLAQKEPLEGSDWSLSIMLGLLGAMMFFPASDLEKTQIDIGKGYIDIKWPAKNKIRLTDSEVDRITLSTNYVFIFRKEKKALKLVLHGEKQKKEVFEFLTEYAREKNLKLVNQDEKPL